MIWSTESQGVPAPAPASWQLNPTMAPQIHVPGQQVDVNPGLDWVSLISYMLLLSSIFSGRVRDEDGAGSVCDAWLMTRTVQLGHANSQLIGGQHGDSMDQLLHRELGRFSISCGGGYLESVTRDIPGGRIWGLVMRSGLKAGQLARDEMTCFGVFLGSLPISSSSRAYGRVRAFASQSQNLRLKPACCS